MKKASSILRAILLTGVLVSFCALDAQAQNSGATQVTPNSTTTADKPIGPAPQNSKQKQILSDALSPETRQTLQQAMNSYNPAPASKSTPTSGK